MAVSPPTVSTVRQEMASHDSEFVVWHSSRMARTKSESVIPIERIASHIYLIRGESVMLDSGLAELYGVSTKRLNEQVSRNRDRFPEDFMF